MLNTGVKEVAEDHIILEDGTRINTKSTMWVGGVRPANLNFDVEVMKTPDGKLVVNEYFEIENHKNIFAIGDVAAFKQNNSMLPALAQVAEKEARAVSENIKLLIQGKNPKPFVYEHSGTLVSLGQWMAIGEMSRFVFWGHITWWIWRTVYLSKLISWEKKIEVALDWTINIFAARDISEL
jgi:NADH dehydrogenase